MDLTSFSFNIVSFVRNTCPTKSFFYKKVIKVICKATLLKVDINQNETTTSSCQVLMKEKKKN